MSLPDCCTVNTEKIRPLSLIHSDRWHPNKHCKKGFSCPQQGCHYPGKGETLINDIPAGDRKTIAFFTVYSTSFPQRLSACTHTVPDSDNLELLLRRFRLPVYLLALREPNIPIFIVRHLFFLYSLPPCSQKVGQQLRRHAKRSSRRKQHTSALTQKKSHFFCKFIERTKFRLTQWVLCFLLKERCRVMRRKELNNEKVLS